MGFARDLARMIDSGKFDFSGLASAEDEVALGALLSVRGIGRWSADVYLLFALGRPDIWPAGDLGLQAAIRDHLGLGARVDEVEVRRLGEAWRPWRSVAACLFWQSYLHTRGRTAPLLPPELCA